MPTKLINKRAGVHVITTTIGGVFLISGIIFAVILVMQPQLINGNAQVINTSYNTVTNICGGGCGNNQITGSSWCPNKDKFCCPIGSVVYNNNCTKCGKSECSIPNRTECINYNDSAGYLHSYKRICTKIEGLKGCPSINVYKTLYQCSNKKDCKCSH